MNNYQKIKAMSIDEMAEYLIEVCKDCNGCYAGEEECKKCMKQWLESESEE